MTSGPLNCRRTGPYFFLRKTIFCENFLPHFSRTYISRIASKNSKYPGLVWELDTNYDETQLNSVEKTLCWWWLDIIDGNKNTKETYLRLLAKAHLLNFPLFLSFFFSNTYTTTHTLCITNFFLCCFNILYTLQTERRITHSITC